VGTAESQQSQQSAQQVQSVPVHEKPNLDNNRTVSIPDDEGFFFCACFTLASDEFYIKLCCFVVTKIYR
jgi:hypothetical protein